MHQRRRRMAVGWVLGAVVTGGVWLAVAAGGPERGVAGAEPTQRVALASVDAFGGLRSAERGWHADRVDVGRYELTFPAPMRVELATWTEIAEVTTRPVSATTWLVTFEVGGGAPVDSAFTFVASPAG